MYTVFLPNRTNGRGIQREKKRGGGEREVFIQNPLELTLAVFPITVTAFAYFLSNVTKRNCTPYLKR